MIILPGLFLVIQLPPRFGRAATLNFVVDQLPWILWSINHPRLFACSDTSDLLVVQRQWTFWLFSYLGLFGSSAACAIFGRAATLDFLVDQLLLYITIRDATLH